MHHLIKLSAKITYFKLEPLVLHAYIATVYMQACKLLKMKNNVATQHKLSIIVLFL